MASVPAYHHTWQDIISTKFTNMKSFVVLALVVAAALAAPQSADKDAIVVRSSNENIGVGGYNFGYETSNGIEAGEQGQVQNQGTDDEGIEVQGSYKYPGPDGVIYTITYTAGRDGFKPVGAHIPVPQ